MRASPSARFVVLASGSGGNAAVIETAAGCLLIDFGLPPRTLDRRMKTVGLGWSRIRAAVLTHTHTDHWKPETLAELAARDIPMFAHPDHEHELSRVGDPFADLKTRDLLKPFKVARPFFPIPGLAGVPVAVPHDSDPTVAFRFDGDGWAVGIASDLGKPPADLLDAFSGVNLLGIEFNHDEQLQRTSRRPTYLIERVLGDHGHLSNRQAASFVRRLLDKAGDHLGHVVQLHLSRECNRPALARAAARTVLAGTKISLTTASQVEPTPFIPLGRRAITSSPTPLSQPLLPGCET